MELIHITIWSRFVILVNPRFSNECSPIRCPTTLSINRVPIVVNDISYNDIHIANQIQRRLNDISVFHEHPIEIAVKMPRQAITVSQKASLRAYHESNPSLDHKALRQWFHQQYQRNISQSSVSEILSARYKSLDHPRDTRRLHSAKRRRVERWPLVEATVQDWLEAESDQTMITADSIRQKAQEVFLQIPEYRGMTVPKFSNS